MNQEDKYMDIEIREMTARDLGRQIEIDGSFIVDSTLVLNLADDRIGYEVKDMPAYTKSYTNEPNDAENTDYTEYIGNPDQIIYLAFAGDQTVGQIVIKRNWNKYAYVEDIQVDKHYRRYGIGRRLLDQALYWAKAGGMPGIMLETQSNNVKACQFYESCGFVIGGFDSYLYKGLDKETDETAIYWYRMLE